MDEPAPLPPARPPWARCAPAVSVALREAGAARQPDGRLAGDEPVFAGIVGYERRSSRPSRTRCSPARTSCSWASAARPRPGSRGSCQSCSMRPPGRGCQRAPRGPILTAAGRDAGRHRDRGRATAIEWLPRHRRYGEKLATPDITIADLIGEVVPIKVAEGRYLADASTIPFGLIPRTNRGIFTLNELPDLLDAFEVPAQHPRRARRPGARLQAAAAARPVRGR